MIDQTYQMRQLFERHPRQWIPLPEIQKVAAQYNARIYDLRTDPIKPMNIENKMQIVNGVRHSWYRYSPPGQEELFGLEPFNRYSGVKLAELS